MCKIKVVCVLGLAWMMGAGLCIAENADGWNTEVSAGLSMTDGNSDTLLWNLGYGAKKTQGANETTVAAGYNYGETEDATTTENATADLQYKRSVSDLIYGFGAASVLYDDIALVDYRAIVGPGLGYRLLNSDAHKVNLELGVVWVGEDVAEVENDYAAVRAAQTWDWQISDTSKLWEKVEYIPDFDNSDNYILNASLGVDSQIRENLSLRVSAVSRFDNEPGMNLEENDLQVLAGLVYKR
jgi:putative salt-induced outer membrane protein